jgi:hypothetical protein
MNRSVVRFSSVLVLAASMLAVLLVFVPALAVQLPLVDDDFEGGAGLWTVQAGNWSITSTPEGLAYSVVYAGAPSTARAIVTETTVPGSTSWTDYRVQAQVKIVTGTGSYNAMLLARYKNSQNYYFMTLRGDNGKVELKRYYAGSSSGRTLTSTGAIVSVGNWYTAALELQGNTLRAYIDGNLVATAVDTNTVEAFYTGTVGLATATSTALFDNVLVTDLRTYTLTVSSAGNGNGTISSEPAGIDCGATCAASYDANNVITLTATPTAGSSFAGWQGASCTGTGSCVVTMSTAKSVAAIFSLNTDPLLIVNAAGNGSGVVTSDPAGINCGAICLAGFAVNTPVTLTAVADTNSLFTGWSGACSGTGTCVVTMDSVKQVTATYALQVFTLDVVKAGTGIGTVASNPAGIDCGATCSASYNINTVVTLTATPLTGSIFSGWNGASCTTGACVVTMLSAQTVTATFDVITYPLTIDRIGNGAGSLSSVPAGINNCSSATCTALFNYDTVVTLTATPQFGSIFAGWNGEGCSGAGACTVTMLAPKNVTATFTLVTHTLSVTKAGNGSGSVVSDPAGIDCGATCAANFDHGTVVTLTATPEAGSSFIGWQGAGCLGDDACVVTLVATRSVTAVFSSNSNPLLMVSLGGDGVGSVASVPAGIDCGTNCVASFAQNTVITLTATPGANTLFAGWCGACSGTGPCVLTLDKAKTARAVFLDTSAILFEDDFESGAGQWTPVSGTWSIALDGTSVYSQTSLVGFSRSVAGSLDWQDIAVQARVKPGTKYAKLIARYQNVGRYYFMALRADTHKIEFKRMNGESSVGLGSTNYPITDGVWYTATFSVVGNQLIAAINGTPVFTRTDDPASAIPTGKIGLGTLDSSAEFDDVLVTSLAPLYTLTVKQTGSGTGQVSSDPIGLDCDLNCVAGLNGGRVITLTATPDAGSTFAGWLGEGCSGTGPCIVTLDANKAVTAVFSSASEPMLVVNQTGTGTGVVTSMPAGIDCGATCAAGFAQNTIVTLTATATNYSTFVGWSGTGCSGTGTCVVTMDVAKSVTGTFAYFTYPLTVAKAGTGQGTITSVPAGIDCGISCTLNVGGMITLTATPDRATHFTGWSGACGGTGACVILMDAAQTVTATFTQHRLYLPIIRNHIVPLNVAPVYVATNGLDTNPGTITQPFKSLTKALAQTTPGQSIFLRGGVYSHTDTITLSKSANDVNLYKIWAYAGEQPVLDFSGSPFGARGFIITGNYWHLQGLEIRNAQDNAIKIEGSYNIIENCVLHHNQDSGLQIGLATESINPNGLLAAYNQVINCDSYRNYDAATNGSNADGFAAKLHPGPGNVFKGDRAWENADDGWDLFLTEYPIVIENSWTWHNGDPAVFNHIGAWGGNGNGFKVGGGPNQAAHILKNCIAFDHKYGPGGGTKGFDQNHNLSGITIYNSLAWDNAVNYSFTEQPTDGTHHVLKNNVGFDGGTNVALSADTIQAANSWTLTLTVTATITDFVSLDAVLAGGPRQADGSLPNDFARLVNDSDLIDKGVDVGLSFLGLAPDLGAFEKR